MNIKNLFSFWGKKAEVANLRTITNDYFPSTISIGTNTSGENVGPKESLSISSVFACINAISQDVAKVPLHLYLKSEEGKNRINNDLDNILNYRANPETSAYQFRKTMIALCLLYGNSYAEIQRDINGKIIALWILPPDKVIPDRDKHGNLIYTFIGAAKDKYLNAYEVIHLQNLSIDGISGIGLVQYAAQSLGNAKALDKYSGAYFGNGASMGGFLEHPQNLSSTAAKNLKESIERQHLGTAKAHRLLLLEEGMKFKEAVISPQDSQCLEARTFTVSEICRFFRITPSKVFDLSRATFSNVEQQSIDYVTDTLSSWYKLIEQELWFKVLSVEEKQQGYFIEHKIEGLLRGDTASRYSAYSIARQWGWLSVNDIRDLENMNRIDGGDIYLQPLNMVPAGTITDKEQKALSIITQDLCKDIANRIHKIELTELDKQLNRNDFNNDKFSEWFENFYIKHFDYIKKTLSAYKKDLTDEQVKSLCMYESIKNSENKKGFFESIKNIYINTIESKVYEYINK